MKSRPREVNGALQIENAKDVKVSPSPNELMSQTPATKHKHKRDKEVESGILPALDHGPDKLKSAIGKNKIAKRLRKSDSHAVHSNDVVTKSNHNLTNQEPYTKHKHTKMKGIEAKTAPGTDQAEHNLKTNMDGKDTMKTDLQNHVSVDVVTAHSRMELLEPNRKSERESTKIKRSKAAKLLPAHKDLGGQELGTKHKRKKLKMGGSWRCACRE